MSFCDRINTPYGEKLLNIADGDKQLAKAIYDKTHLENDFVEEKKSDNETHNYLDKLFPIGGDISINKTQIGSIIDTIVNNTKEELLKESLKIFKDVLVNSNVQYTTDKSAFSNTENLLGTSKGDKFTIFSDKIMYDKSVTIEDVNHIIVHELVHNATTTKLDTDEKFRNNILEYKKLIPEELLKRYKITDEYEFVAELFSNKNFVDELKVIPYEKQSLLHKIFDTILEVLGIKKDNINIYNHFKNIVIENTPNEYKMFSDTQHNFLIGEKAVLTKDIKELFNKAIKKIDLKLKNISNGTVKSYEEFKSIIKERLDLMNADRNYFIKVKQVIDTLNKTLSEEVPNVYLGYDGKLRYDIKSLVVIDKSKPIKDNMFLGDVLDKEKSSILQFYLNIAYIKIINTNDDDGGYVPSTNTIYINLNSKEANKTILHELQHYIQTFEGFLEGQSPSILAGDIIKYSYEDILVSFIRKHINNVEESTLRDFIGGLLSDTIIYMFTDNNKKDVKEFLLEEVKKNKPDFIGLVDNELVSILINYGYAYGEYVIKKYYGSLGEAEARYVEGIKKNYREYIEEISNNRFYNLLYDTNTNEFSKLRDFLFANPSYPFQNTIRKITIFSKNGKNYGFYKDGEFYHPFVDDVIDNKVNYTANHVFEILFNIIKAKQGLDDNRISYSNIFDTIKDGKEMAFLMNNDVFLKFKKDKKVKFFGPEDFNKIENLKEVLKKLNVKPNEKPIIAAIKYSYLDNEGKKILIDTNNIMLIKSQKIFKEKNEKTKENENILPSFENLFPVEDYININQEPNDAVILESHKKLLSLFLGDDVLEKIEQKISKINPFVLQYYQDKEGVVDIRFINDKGEIAFSPEELSGSYVMPILYNEKEERIALTEEPFKVLNIDLNEFLNNEEIEYILESLNVTKKTC